MNRNAIIGAGAAAFAISALIGAIWLGASAIAPAVFCGVAIAIVLGVAEALARPARDRQLHALERLADQGRALPEAADALASAVERLRQLETSLGEAHAESIHETRRVVEESAAKTSAAIGTAVSEAQRTFERMNDAAHAAADKEREETSRVLRHTADRIREDLSRGVADAAKAAQEAVTPVAADAMKKAAEAATTHLAEVRAAIESDATERRRVQAVAVETLDSHLKEVAERLNAQLEHRADADARLLIALEAHSRQIREAEDTRAAELGERWREMSEQLAGLEERRAARFEELCEAEARRASEISAKVETLGTTVLSTLGEVAENDAARSEQIEALTARVERNLTAITERVSTDLGEAATIVRERLEASASAEAAQTARSADLIEKLAAVGDAQRASNTELIGKLSAAGEEQSARSAELIDRFSEAGRAMTQATAAQCAALEAFALAADKRVEKAEDGGAARIADLALRFEAAAEAQQKRLAVFEEELAGRQRAGVEALATHLSEHARGIDETLRETAQLVHQAAGLVHAGGGEMTAVAEMFAGAVDKQREAANTWIESLGKIDQAVVDAGENAAVDVLGNYLARTHELFDQQLGFQQELFEQLTVGTERPAASPA